MSTNEKPVGDSTKVSDGRNALLSVFSEIRMKLYAIKHADYIVPCPIAPCVRCRKVTPKSTAYHAAISLYDLQVVRLYLCRPCGCDLRREKRSA